MTKKLLVSGVVQGVGFRPYCKRLADELKIDGTVKNLGSDAEIIICAENRVSEEFLRRLLSSLPTGARIDSVSESACEEFTERGFAIVPSGESDTRLPEIIPDIATCGSCLKELYEPSNRRFRHPFISCTVCGPRYSIIRELPYDRKNTLMSEFPLCPACEKEYRDIADRRCHAQTIACRTCGPRLSYYPKSRQSPINAAISAVKNGGVIGVKDIGGFHFVCLPDREEVVKQLRLLKLREQKPFAVMFPDIAALKEYAELNAAEQTALEGSARPIVLLEKTKDFCPAVCGGSRYIGAMLPSNPIQHMLCKALGPLIMTSGNLSGEPIITDNSAMLELARDNRFLDGVLYHDRDIVTPLDDSVFYVLGNTVHLSRRGRGVVPESIRLETPCEQTVFAAGGDLKACFGFYKNGRAILSQHFGDLEDEAACGAYRGAVKHMSRLFGLSPDIFVCDRHPAYQSAAFTEKYADGRVMTVQHHHAHIASVMAEHSLETVLGFALDGTGYGDDGTVWGGEALICEGDAFIRAAHLSSVPLCGGDEASKNACETLACYLIAADRPIPEHILSPEEGRLLTAAIGSRIGCLPSSSAGRLFDAVSALLSLGAYNHYEGQCAVALENRAAEALKDGVAPEPLSLPLRGDVLDAVSLVADMSDRLADGADIGGLALGFHQALAQGLLTVAERQNIPCVALSGGVFANRILTGMLKEKLRDNGFKVYMNQKVPCGDGGIALGQLYLAAKAAERK